MYVPEKVHLVKYLGKGVFFIQKAYKIYTQKCIQL